MQRDFHSRRMPRSVEHSMLHIRPLLSKRRERNLRVGIDMHRQQVRGLIKAQRRMHLTKHRTDIPACAPDPQTSNAASEAAVVVAATAHLQRNPTSLTSSSPSKASEAAHTKTSQVFGQSDMVIFALSQLAAENWVIRTQSLKLKASNFWHAT